MKQKLRALIVSAFITTSMFSQTTPRLVQTVERDAMERWVDAKMSAMTVNERIGQLFMPIVSPGADAAGVAKALRLVKEYHIGGVLFQKGSPIEQVRLTNRLQEVAAATAPLLIALDGEWGLSMRLSETTRFPKNMMLGAISNLELIERYGEEVGRQCREMGIHVNFAPVMDVNVNANNPVIGNRSFGEDPSEVTAKACAYARGLESAGVISVAKHFPGHGDTDVDSHAALPVINHDLSRLNRIELYPFKRYIREGFSGIMVAHLNIPALGTDGRAGSLTREVVTDLLRDKLGFGGLCFTDGLAMKGAATGKDESVCVLALQAGNDVLVGPIDMEAEVRAVRKAVRDGELSMRAIDDACRRILRYKYIAGLNKYKPVETASLTKRLNSPEAERLNAQLNAEAITIVKNDGAIVPLKQLAHKRIAAVSIGAPQDNVFQAYLRKYAKVECFNIASKADAATAARVYRKLNDYDVVICGIYNNVRESDELRRIAAEKQLIYVFFTVPYVCADFARSVGEARSLIVAYEATDYAQRFAAQAVFGGIAAHGSLPVEIPQLFATGVGVQTKKTRLGYDVPEAVDLSSAALTKVDSIAREGIDKEAYPGCRILIARRGKIIYDKAFGYYDYTNKERVTENTVYDLASVTKATATLLGIMRSYDDGNFKLNDRISEHIKELRNSDKSDITIKDMLYHQSGLPAVVNFYEQAIDRNSFSGSLYSGRRDAAHTVRYDARTFVNTNYRFYPQNVSRTKKQGFTVKAGNNLYLNDAFPVDSVISGVKAAKMGAVGKYTYSCVNFILLKLMLERQYGEPLDRMLDRHFFSRLGAWTTTYNPLAKVDTGLIAPTERDVFIRRQTIRGYVHDEAAAFQGGVSGNAGLFSSAGDLAKVLQLYLNDGSYGGEEFISSKTCRFFTGSRNTTSRRGLGFDKPETPSSRAKSPCGELAPQSVYGHTGYTGTCFWIDPDNEMFFIFLSNRTMPSRTNSKLSSLSIRQRIQDAIYRAIQTSY
jgi:beta-glucosidase-like glycosyl hydrolase/CubicO group peptidase (beta-lactamase class C family)